MKPHDDPAVPGTGDWTAQNQRWLVGELARLRGQVEERLRPAAAECTAESGVAPPVTPWSDARPPALARVAALFALSAFESDVLLLAAGVELDRALRALLPSGLSFSLAMSLLDGAHWDAMSPQAPLRRWQLVHLVPAHAPVLPAHGVLQIDERILHALTGVAATDERLRGLVSWPAGAADADTGAAGRVAEALLQAPAPVLVWLRAPLGAGAALLRDTAVAGAHGAGRAALQVALDDVPADAAAADTLACRLDREAALADAVLVLMPEPPLMASAESLHRLAVFLARLCSPVVLAAGTATPPRAALWRSPRRVQIDSASAEAESTSLTPPQRAALAAALRQFEVDRGRLREVIDGLQGTPEAAWPAQLWHGLREATRGGLDALAQRIASDTQVDHLVLPNAQREQLREIAAQLAQRERVYREWGFGSAGARGLGIAALFAGDSGTGKTMAAEAIANAAALDLYRVDLAGTVSKYIGETEKNLKRLFDAAEASGAVLLFDEADALFGKRSDVKDSHDRYANIETAYLLQRIESYRGLAILTTNLKSALDRAFLRRIRFVVQFPFPDAAARESIWRHQFAAAAPLQDVDFAALARWHLAGGNIRTVALNAAFKAAHEGVAIGPRHLQAAAAAEFAKLERSGGPLGNPS